VETVLTWKWKGKGRDYTVEKVRKAFCWGEGVFYVLLARVWTLQPLI